MPKQQFEGGFVSSVVNNDGEIVTIEVSEEDYQRERAAGVEDESLLKPGRYKLNRGGFMARHLKMKPKQRKQA